MPTQLRLNWSEDNIASTVFDIYIWQEGERPRLPIASVTGNYYYATIRAWGGHFLQIVPRGGISSEVVTFHAQKAHLSLASNGKVSQSTFNDYVELVEPATFTQYEISDDDQPPEILQRFSWRLKKQTKFNHFFVLVLKDLSPSGKKYTTRNIKADKTSLVAIVKAPGSHWSLEMHLKEASGTWRILKSPQFSIKIENKHSSSFGDAMADAINALPRQTHSHQLIYSE